MNKKLLAAIDLGGTKTYTVLADLQGKILASIREETMLDKNPDTIIKQMASTVDRVLAKAGESKSQLAGAGVCAAGFFDWQNKMLISSPNIPGLNMIALEKELEHKLEVPVIAENDANAQALGEARYGAGEGFNNLIFITVSTGIGAGLIFNGNIYRGSKGFAGEIGHMVVNPNGLRCGCGKRGCLETVSSGSAIAQAAANAISKGESTSLSAMLSEEGNITAAHVFEAAKHNDAIAQEILANAIEYLGTGIVNLVNTLNPEVIILGGGVAESGDALFGPLRKFVAQNAISPSRFVQIKKAKLNVEAGVAGMLRMLTDIHAVNNR